jgi:hypothetical protein
MTRDPARNVAQAHALYEHHQQGKARVEDTARRLGVSPRCVYAWAENLGTVPAWAIGPLWDLYGDADLVVGLIGPTERPYVFAPTPEPLGEPSALIAACESLRAAGEFVAEVARDVEDGQLDPSESLRVIEAVTELQRRLKTLELAVGGAS